ncbi:MAG: thioesterase family protein [Pseudomonadota bacterium]
MRDKQLKLGDIPLPEVYSGKVQPEWIDVNDHMNVAWYLLAFDYGIDGLWHQFGISDERRDLTGDSTFAVESHVRYLNELRLDEAFVIQSHVIAYDEKRIHQFQYLFSKDSLKLSATCEWLHLHVDLNTRRVTPWPEDLLRNIAAHPCSTSSLTAPEALGQVISIQKPINAG